MLFYRAALLSPQTLNYVAGVIGRDRKQRRSRWRRLNPGQEVLMVLVYLRKGEALSEVGAGFGVSTTTCWRRVGDTVGLLAERAPRLRAALRAAKRAGWRSWSSMAPCCPSTGWPLTGLTFLASTAFTG
jgi:hypothetical protein